MGANNKCGLFFVCGSIENQGERVNRWLRRYKSGIAAVLPEQGSRRRKAGCRNIIVKSRKGRRRKAGWRNNQVVKEGERGQGRAGLAVCETVGADWVGEGRREGGRERGRSSKGPSASMLQPRGHRLVGTDRQTDRQTDRLTAGRWDVCTVYVMMYVCMGMCVGGYDRYELVQSLKLTGREREREGADSSSRASERVEAMPAIGTMIRGMV